MTQAQDRRETLARVTAMLARRLSDSPCSVSQVAQHAMDLCVVSRSLSRIAERGCNEDRGCKACRGECQVPGPYGTRTLVECAACAGTGSMDGKRERRLEAKAQAIAALYGLRCYFQGDPRGAALYLIPQDAGPQSEDDSHYSQRGVAAY